MGHKFRNPRGSLSQDLRGCICWDGFGIVLGWLWDARAVPQEPSTAGEGTMIAGVGREEILNPFPCSWEGPRVFPGSHRGCAQSIPGHKKSLPEFCTAQIICFHTQDSWSRLFNLWEILWERFGERSAPQCLLIRSHLPNIQIMTAELWRE